VNLELETQSEKKLQMTANNSPASDNRFKVGVSADLRRPDGTLVIPEADLSLLEDNDQIRVTTLENVGGGHLTAEHIGDNDAIILMLERIDAQSFTDNQPLTAMARYGVGFDTIDTAACTRNDVALAIAPDGVRRPVATTVMGFLLALTLRLPEKDKLTRQSDPGWAVKTNYNGTGLVGRTLGGIGLGNIGAEVFRLAQPFDMKLIAHDPYVDPSIAASLNVQLVGLEDVFRQSDFLTVNCLLNDETRHIVNAERLALMKETAYLINTARGPVVDEPALIAALQNGAIAGAGLDVFEQEPISADNPLVKMDNVILSPHALCFTDQCMRGLGDVDVKVCLDIMQGTVPQSVVNQEVLDQPGFRNKLEALSRRHS
jgi:phosphoglycerate dehydrogenase-like enzyme